MAVVSLTLSALTTLKAREYASRFGLIFLAGVECEDTGRTMTLFERPRENPGYRFLIEVRDRNGKNIGSAHISSRREVLTLFNKIAATVSKHSGISFQETLRQETKEYFSPKNSKKAA